MSLIELIPHDRPVSFGHVWRKAKKEGASRHEVNAGIKSLIASGDVIQVNAQIQRAKP